MKDRPGAPRPRASPARELPSHTEYARIARLLRAVADDCRLRLLAELGEQELTVTEVAARLSVPFLTASAQLRALWAQRLVQRRRSGSHVFYRRAEGAGREVVDLVLAWMRRPPASA